MIRDRFNLDDLCECGHELKEHTYIGDEGCERGSCTVEPTDYCFVFHRMEPHGFINEKCTCGHLCKDHRRWDYMWHDYCYHCKCQRFTAWVYSFHVFNREVEKERAKILIRDREWERDKKRMDEILHRESKEIKENE